MKVISFTLDVNYVNVYLAVDEQSQAAFLVDCGAFVAEMEETIRRMDLDLKFLLITHTHYDHVDGIPDFRKLFQAPIYSATDKWDVRVSAADTIAFGARAIKILATPGHTADGISFYIENAVFVGDAIFAGAVGGTTTREHFKQQQAAVRDKILTLPDATMIYPGHGASSLVGVERLHNPFFA